MRQSHTGGNGVPRDERRSAGSTFGFRTVLPAVVVALAACLVVLSGLSPVGMVAGQDEDATPANASITVENQTADGPILTIERVALPDAGFVTLHTAAYADGLESTSESFVASSDRLPAGTYENVTVEIPAPSANAGENTTYTVGLANDSNQDGEYDTPIARESPDVPFPSAEDPLMEVVEVRVPDRPNSTATVQLSNQTIGGESVRLDSARLPDGGFVAIHNRSYLSPENNTLRSAVGLTPYLAPGNYTDRRVPLIAGSVATNQTLVAVAYRDTNDNQEFEYVTSDGFRDTAYENSSGNETVVVTDRALVRRAGTGGAPGTATGTDTATATETTSPPVSTTEAGEEDGMGEEETELDGGMVGDENTSTPFRVRNLTVSNASVYVGDEVIVTAKLSNPTDGRLEDELVLESVGGVAATEEVALFANETRSVSFEVSYDAPGEYILRVGPETRHIRVVAEGGPLTTTAGPGAVNGSAGSSEPYGLVSWPMFVAVGLLLLFIAWAYRKRQGSQHPR